jgi:hypothetical protein
MPRRPNRTVEERFWSHVDQTGDCWLWLAATRNGYGQFHPHGDRTAPAHRFAYELVRGPIPEGRQLDHRHTCPKHCVNPWHLRPATKKQNAENLAGLLANNTSGVRGVWWAAGRWRASVTHHGRAVHVGRFDTIEEAEAAVIAKRNELFTHNDVDRRKKP